MSVCLCTSLGVFFQVKYRAIEMPGQRECSFKCALDVKNMSSKMWF